MFAFVTMTSFGSWSSHPAKLRLMDEIESIAGISAFLNTTSLLDIPDLQIVWVDTIAWPGIAVPDTINMHR